MYCVYFIQYEKNSMRSAILLLLPAFEARRRAGSSRGCNDYDIAQLGGSADAMFTNLEKCLPETISESDMELIEGCVIITFTPDNLSDDCKKCSNKYLESRELDLKSCMMKCGGVGRQSNLCLKCKDSIGTDWTASCFSRPEKASQSNVDEDDLSVKSFTTLPFITVTLPLVLILASFV